MDIFERKIGDVFPDLKVVRTSITEGDPLHVKLRYFPRSSPPKRGQRSLTPSEGLPDIFLGDLLNSSNHAFYLGAVQPQTTADRALRLLAPQKRSIYDEEHVLGLLWELEVLWKSGVRRLNVKLIPQLHFLFNQNGIGPKPDFQTIKTYLFSLAERHFGVEFAKVIEFEDPSESIRHADLFRALESNGNPYEVIKGDLCTESTGIDRNGVELLSLNSLEVAQRLSQAASEDPRLRKDLKATLPSRLKQSTKEEPLNGYALTELAIRIVDLIRGQNIQGGMDRQFVYDEIIEDIMKGKKGPYRRNKVLYPIFSALEGKAFLNLYYPAPNKFEQRIVRSRACTRLALKAAAVSLFGLSLGGVYEWGRLDERKDWEAQQSEVAQKTIECAADVPFRECDSDNWCRNDYVSPLKRAKVFKGFEDSGLTWLSKRYGIERSDPSEELQLRSLWVDHLCGLGPDTVASLGTAMEFGPRFVAEVDNFVVSHSTFFDLEDVDVSRPYANLFPHKELFEKAANSLEDLTVSCAADFNFLAEYTPPREYQGPYTFYVEEGPNGKRLWTKGTEWDSVAKTNHCVFSTAEAKKGARQFLVDSYRFDARKLDKFYSEGLLWAPVGSAPTSVSPDAPELANEEPMFYTDPLGRNYELKRFHYYDDQSDLSSDYLVARLDGDTSFSVQRTAEVENIYIDLVLQRPTFFAN